MTIMRRREGKEEEGRETEEGGGLGRTRPLPLPPRNGKRRTVAMQKSLPLCPACAAGVDFSGETSTVLSSPKKWLVKNRATPLPECGLCFF